MGKAKPTILFYNFGARLGGAENVLLTFLTIPSEKVNYRVLLNEYGTFYDKLKEINIPVDVIETKASSFYALKREDGLGSQIIAMIPRFLKLFFQVVAYFKKHSFSLIVSNTYKSHLIAGFAANLYGFKVVWRFHDILQHEYAHNNFSMMNIFFLKFLSQGVSQISGVSRAVTASFEAYGFNPNKLNVVHNGLGWVPNGKIIGNESHHIRIGWIGQFAAWKGIEEFISLGKRLIDRQDEFSKSLHITIAGSALFGNKDYEQSIRNLVSPDYQPHFTFLGHISDVDAFYSNIDIFFHTSIAPDPFPTTILEAGSQGLLVFASELGGAREIITDNVNGFLINMQDETATLNKAIDVLNNFETQKDKGELLKSRIGQGLNSKQYHYNFETKLLQAL